jgi:perosamine synthetase
MFIKIVIGIMKVQLRKPYFPQKSINKIQPEIKKVLQSGRLTLGENVKKLEVEFAKFESSKYAVAVSSATSGLHISLLGLNIKKGDEVIVPAKTFISTANAVLYCNAKPVFCDVDEDTFQLNPEKLLKLITKKTKAIIPVHLGGNISPMKEILKISHNNNLKIVEDCAHAHGSTMNNKKSGTFGDIGVFSFYPDKIIASCDGGIIVTDNSKVFEKLQLLRNVGRKQLGQDIFSEIGFNYRMNEIQAILALEQLKILPKMIKRRRQVAKIYDDAFKDLSELQSQKIPKNVENSYYAYILRLKNKNLFTFLDKLTKKGIETSLMFKTIYRHKAYQKNFKIRNHCPISEKLDKETFTIPLHAGIKNEEVEFVINTIKNSLKGK